MTSRPRPVASLSVWTLVCAYFCILDRTVHAVYNDSIFSQRNYYPRPWWAVSNDELPELANSALALRTGKVLQMQQ